MIWILTVNHYDPQHCLHEVALGGVEVVDRRQAAGVGAHAGQVPVESPRRHNVPEAGAQRVALVEGVDGRAARLVAVVDGAVIAEVADIKERDASSVGRARVLF